MTTRSVAVLEPLRRVRENHRAESEVALIHEVGQTVREVGGKVLDTTAVALCNPTLTLLAGTLALAWASRQTVMKKVYWRAGTTEWYWDYYLQPEPMLDPRLATMLEGVIVTQSALSSLSTAIGGLLPAVLAFLTKGKA